MSEKTLVPAEGRTVPLEDGSPWPTDDKGRPIPFAAAPSRYVRRRVKDGDLVAPKTDQAEPAQPDPEPVPEETTPKAGGARRREKTES
ncbi:hypothetical protein [Amorphus coralli]|uniref:hypothetical protein n=1 Tax=Amorphus coralli TaxID=340680 RepID=UPI00035CE749|nr:hypothetical protein [Amorphus coralli]